MTFQVVGFFFSWYASKKLRLCDGLTVTVAPYLSTLFKARLRGYMWLDFWAWKLRESDRKQARPFLQRICCRRVSVSWKAMKSQVLHTVWCNILTLTPTFFHLPDPLPSVVAMCFTIEDSKSQLFPIQIIVFVGQWYLLVERITWYLVNGPAMTPVRSVDAV